MSWLEDDERGPRVENTLDTELVPVVEAVDTVVVTTEVLDLLQDGVTVELDGFDEVPLVAEDVHRDRPVLLFETPGVGVRNSRTGGGFDVSDDRHVHNCITENQ